MEIHTNGRTTLLFLLALLLFLAMGFSRYERIAKADDLPPIYVDYFLPSIQNHPTSIGLPPDPIP